MSLMLSMISMPSVKYHINASNFAVNSNTGTVQYVY